MTTLDSLKQALIQQAATSTLLKQPLTDAQYRAGFNLLASGPGCATYRDFIIPQLIQLLDPFLASRPSASVLEVGPGPKSVLGCLPDYQRQKITRYVSFEPNHLFASSLEGWLRDSSDGNGTPLPCLERPPDIHRRAFGPDSNRDGTASGPGDTGGRFDVVLFCHSMYGMQPKEKFIHRALELLDDRSRDGLVLVFHRDSLHLDGLVCHRTASFPTGLIRVTSDNDKTLDCFAAFISGFTPPDDAVKAVWRSVCRALGSGWGDAHSQGLLSFSAPDVMMAFTRHATTLPELLAVVPLADRGRIVKNREARRHRPAAMVRPHGIQQIQECVRWALRNRTKLTTIGGGHSGHCVLPGIVAVDLGAFNRVDVVARDSSAPLVVVEAGSTVGHVICKTMAMGLSVPLGARPSVGAGLWLQGGIGHLARQHGLACDAIVGAVVVSVVSGEVLCIGKVPSQHQPHGSASVEALDLLWAIKGAGTNFGIVLSVTFKACPAPTYSVRSWILQLVDRHEAVQKLDKLDGLVIKDLPPSCAADAYLYWDDDQLRLGVTMFQTSPAGHSLEVPRGFTQLFGPPARDDTVDAVGAFESEMYMSGMHGGHGGGKTSSFKRCVFLKRIGQATVGDVLTAAVTARPTPLCYLHLLHGGGAVGDVPADSTAFGCRHWDFACVITGVWPRDQDGTTVAAAAVSWVYRVAGQLLPLSNGAYGADLGPDPRDAVLAARAFGENLPRLARLKQDWDPQRVLAYTCPIPESMEPKLVVLVTGDSGAGKDYCADVWVSVFANQHTRARAVSISEATKREYAEASGADVNRLLQDRDYKDQHRPELTAFFQAQVQQNPRLPQQHFLDAVYGAADVEVLFITGMRDEAPVATFSALVPSSRLVQVNVTRMPFCSSRAPTLAFSNTTLGASAAETFAAAHLLPRLSSSLDRLAALARPVPSFPRAGIQFRHVLNIAQHRGGLALCASLLQDHLPGEWGQVAAIVCVEAGGFVFAAALGTRTGVPLALVRGRGRLPPPTVCAGRKASHISGISGVGTRDMEIEAGAVPEKGWVVVVDDVLATGETLCAVLTLLVEAGVSMDRVVILVVAEFPLHQGRERLRQQGFGAVDVHSLVVFDGM